jgi:glycine hydroxymethyltransferase
MSDAFDAVRQAAPEVYELIRAEEQREARTIRLIASENYASRAVMQATGSIFTNKYCEGYPHKRYYYGQEFADRIEDLARDRACELFGAEHANVQPYSGSPANLAAYFALLDEGDSMLAMDLPHGGHLTHGWKVSITGSFYTSHHYPVSRDSERLDYDEVRRLAREHNPKLIICGASAYPRVIDFEAFREIADEVGALLLADIAHISGLVAAGVHPSPVPVADVVTTTTHKTLRGPRGGLILCTEEHASAIDRAVFPGLQGGPHMHAIAALAVALAEAMQPDFVDYAEQIVANAKAMAEAFKARGYRLVSDGTDNHLLLVDVGARELSGKPVAEALERAGIVCNPNTIPYDPRKPWDPSGIRIGTPAVTSRGMGPGEMQQIVDWCDRAISSLDDEDTLDEIRGEVESFTEEFPIPGVD